MCASGGGEQGKAMKGCHLGKMKRRDRKEGRERLTTQESSNFHEGLAGNPMSRELQG